MADSETPDWIEQGSKAPDFYLHADDGQKVKLSDLKGSPVVLYFYPKDDTPGCTREACAFRDRKKELTKLGAKVFGVSPDDVASHEKFRDKFELNFPLLADLDHKVADKYGAWREKNMYGKKSMGIQRSTFLIAADGKVAKVWKKVNVDGHDEEVIAALKELRVAADCAAQPYRALCSCPPNRQTDDLPGSRLAERQAHPDAQRLGLGLRGIGFVSR